MDCISEASGASPQGLGRDVGKGNRVQCLHSKEEFDVPAIFA